jgi:hypothetical protein
MKKGTCLCPSSPICYCLITKISRGGMPVIWICWIWELVRLRPTKIKEEVKLSKLPKSATFWRPRNTRMAPWKLVRENKTNVTLSVNETFRKRKLERMLLKRNAPISRIATPPRLRTIRLTVKFLPENSWSLTSVFANSITLSSE